MNIKIITVGNKSSIEISSLIEDYIKRLPRTVTVTWKFLKHGLGDTTSSKHHESEDILKALPDKSYVILLDETGKQLSNNELSNKVFRDSMNVTFVIGGAFGVDDSIKNKADFTWSLSSLVMPHELVRLILTEQIYRSYAISVNHPYHHA